MGFLTRKLGPLPVWGWLLAAVAVFVAYRRFRSSSTAVATTQAPPAAAPAPDQGLGGATQAGSPADNGAATSDLLSAYAAQEGSLLDALGSQTQAVVTAAQSIGDTARAQLAAMGSSPTGVAAAPQDTSTAATTQPQPGGSNAPTFQFVFPNITGQTSTTGAAPKTTIKPAAQPKPAASTKYYTYKRNVPIKPNQTVHFASGKGYYAA